MILVITGPMASGKSTVAQLVAEGLPRAVHLRGDVFRKMVVSGRQEMGPNPTDEAVRQLKLRYRLAAAAAKQYHSAGFDVVVQDNYYGEMLPHFVNLLAPEKPHVAVLCPSAEAIARRERARGKTGYGGFEVDALHREFIKATPKMGLWLDSSNETPQQTARRIEEYLQSEAR